ncbi:Non-ribosomal peptide synthetase modules (EC 6.3.2.-) [Mycetohabitans rhizoxinica HKI 454]|uniref:Non-ribosomal peptide synthetase modules n=1 Tax=Mycetohabitans rhizoxinica (strain DSM 19002 / CIP 109453 / HKI 454) TaxID=882378 RepID=E5AL77_MYCRK|nr:Non-ribosomal peptide synthetase modules (EC 6.3.2.-) [Mycetohabitans rhizoxinica HKI 454]
MSKAIRVFDRLSAHQRGQCGAEFQRSHPIVMDGFSRYLLAQRVKHVYSALC